MPRVANLIKCAETDPRRCQGIGSGGQCRFLSMEGLSYCPAHQVSAQPAKAKKDLKNYRLQQYEERVTEFATNPEIKNLREEIGIMRMTLESILVGIKDSTKLLLYSDKITSMVNQIGKLIEAAQRLEEKNNNLLDRKIVVVIADSLVTIVSQYISDPDKLNEIGGKICESIERAASPTYSGRVTAESSN